jgi:hypothetical protein
MKERALLTVALLAAALMAACAPQQPKSAYHDQDPLGNAIEDEMNRDISKNNNPVGQAIDAEAGCNPASPK